MIALIGLMLLHRAGLTPNASAAGSDANQVWAGSYEPVLTPR